MDSQAQAYGGGGGWGHGNGPAVLARLPYAPSCCFTTRLLSVIAKCSHSPPTPQALLHVLAPATGLNCFILFIIILKRDTRILCLGRSQAGLVLSAEIFHLSSVPRIIFVFFDTQPRYSHSKEIG